MVARKFSGVPVFWTAVLMYIIPHPLYPALPPIHKGIHSEPTKKPPALIAQAGNFAAVMI